MVEIYTKPTTLEEMKSFVTSDQQETAQLITNMVVFFQILKKY